MNMQITREQEIALWKLMAESLNLTHEAGEIYVGNCPFCPSQDYFGLSTTGLAYCRGCKFETYSLALLVRRLSDFAFVG